MAEDWCLRAANRIADEHKGAWAGVMLQVEWMASVIAAEAPSETCDLCRAHFPLGGDHDCPCR